MSEEVKEMRDGSFLCVNEKGKAYWGQPEGYPSKSVGTVTLMEERGFAFNANPTGVYVTNIQENPPEIVVGQTYIVKWDGIDYECVSSIANSIPVIGNLSIEGAGDDTGEPFLYFHNKAVPVGIFETLDTSTSHTISVKTTEEIITPIDEKYLPDNLATKSDVEATQEVLDGVFSSVATFTFDKQTSGRDTFNFNSFNYYKISDFNPSPSDVISYEGTNELGNKHTGINTGNNCAEYGGGFIVVASAGVCSLAISETTTKSFIAPSAGLYAQYEADNPRFTAGTAEFTLKPSSENYIYIKGLFLKSSTLDSTKKFKITVDDSGTLSAVQV